jgi:hypothetical protein
MPTRGLPDLGNIYAGLFLEGFYTDEPILTTESFSPEDHTVPEAARAAPAEEPESVYRDTDADAPRAVRQGNIGGAFGVEQSEPARIPSRVLGSDETTLSFDLKEQPDPSNPPNPPNLATVGRPPYQHPTEAAFIKIVSSRPDRVLEAVKLLANELAVTSLREIGFGIQRNDTTMQRAWVPLAKSTLAARQRRGNISTMPWNDTGKFAQEAIGNKWGTNVTIKNNAYGGQDVTASFGPRDPADDQDPSEAFRDREAGYIGNRIGKKGPRAHIPPRALRLTQQMQRRIGERAKEWAMSHVGDLANQESPGLTEGTTSSLPAWSVEPSGPMLSIS